MRIILDAMGGDNAPDANIKGAVNAIPKDLTLLRIETYTNIPIEIPKKPAI